MSTLPVISIRQPWAYHILNNGKDIENRDWATKFRGRILIHASKGCTRAEYDAAAVYGPLPPLADLERGGIVGSITITDCVDQSDSRWFFGKYGFVLSQPKPIPFIPLKGQLGIFKVPAEILEQSQ